MNFSNDTSNKEGFHLMPSRRAIIRGIAATALFTLAGTNVYAETFPTKPVRILVPYAAGGAVDVLARTLGQSLSKTWGQQPVIENRPGAGGIIASQALTQSAPDGYTLILVASGHPLNQFFYPKLPYDTFKDFTAISEIAYSPLAIVVSNNSPVKNLQELLATARAKPESLSYGMSGNGTSAHLAGELFKSLAKVDLTHVAYKGAAPAISDLLAGQIDVMFTTVASVTGHIQGGQLRALAVTSAARSHAFPDLPTVAEAGVPGYVAESWYGLYAPAATPPEIIMTLNQAVARAAQSDSVKRFEELEGLTLVAGAPAELDRYVRGEEARWRSVVEGAGIKAE
jgi:tripartite-type tricarboxylate transporter receptor subunit TctC